MKTFYKTLHWFWITCLVGGLGLAIAQEDNLPPASAGQVAWVLTIDGAIGPATASYIVHQLQHAAEQSAALIVLEMDTPGGLDDAMRDIVQAIIRSPIPVVTYVSPSGARAASAGTYILLASHVAAMAPGTNLGAATPVMIGGVSLPSSYSQVSAEQDSVPPSPANSAPKPSPAANAEETEQEDMLIRYAEEMQAQSAKEETPAAKAPQVQKATSVEKTPAVDSEKAPADETQNIDTKEGEESEEDQEDQEGEEEAGEENIIILQEDDPMHRKLVNDAEAYIRALANLHNRNAEWAATAVREAASLAANEALDQGVIDLISPDLTTLLADIDGRVIQIKNQKVTLNTQKLILYYQKPDWRNQLLSVFTDPDVAYMLMLLGVYGLFFEFISPGGLIPGVLGGVSMLLALFAFQVLPVNYAGLGLIALGLSFLVSEAFIPSFGILGIGGLVSFVIGSVILYDSELPEYQVSKAIIVGFVFVAAGLILWIVRNFAAIRNRPPITGKQALIGMNGICVQATAQQGLVRVNGELWQAQCEHPLTLGQTITVLAVHGLVLAVK